MVDRFEHLYTGEVDLSDNPCGVGTAISDIGIRREMGWKQEGTYLNGKEHGFGMSLCMQDGA